MNKKVLIITLVTFLVVLGVAAVLYPKLSAGMQTAQLATTPTETTAPAETTASAATEAAQEEPQPIQAPELTFLDWDGNEVKLSDYFGKPIVLNFWAHWCGPCQREMPEFNAMYEELDGEVTFLMVHMGAAVEEGKAKVTEGGYTFPVVFDTQREAAYVYGVNSYPTSFFIDKDGNVQGYYVGIMNRSLLQQGVDRIYAK